MRSWMLAALVVGSSLTRPTPAADTLAWRGQEIDAAVGKVCYAVVPTDVDGDGKLDIVAVANDAVVWYQNPTWQKRDILRNATEPDNVCLQPHDVDGDGRVDFALGSAWRPTDTKTGGNLAIITRTGAPEGTWRIVPIGAEPTLHRVRWGNILHEAGKAQLIVAPLQGRGTKGPEWNLGSSSSVFALSIPARPFDDPWPMVRLPPQLHTVHNIEVINTHQLLVQREATPGLLLAAWEGVFSLHQDEHRIWSLDQIGAGDQSSRPNRGTSEVRLGHRRDALPFVATIEPWHGHQFVVYHSPVVAGSSELVRHVIDDSLAWGHAVACADLDGDGDDEVVVGQRDPNVNVEPDQRGPGVLIYDPKPASYPIAFNKSWVDRGGIAVEDLVVADLDADGRPDLIAGGRATHNVKIFWNEPQP